MIHNYERFVFDGDWFFDGWLCLKCRKQVTIDDSPDGAPQDTSECVASEVQDGGSDNG